MDHAESSCAGTYSYWGDRCYGNEEASYQVKKEGKFEVRDYASHILAETLVAGDLEDAGNNAFQRLFSYLQR